MILCSFFFVIVILVPMTFICYYQNSRNFAVNGVPSAEKMDELDDIEMSAFGLKYLWQSIADEART